MAYQSINPFNGELLQTFDHLTDLQMESALAKADSTFQHVWSKAKPVSNTARYWWPRERPKRHGHTTSGQVKRFWLLTSKGN
jgi:hypothetical protein